MTKEQYKLVIRALKEQAKPIRAKLIHMLINYRSHNDHRYPKGMMEVMRDLKAGRLLFDSSGVWLFWQLEGDRWRRPCFPCRRLLTFENRETESDLPF